MAKEPMVSFVILLVFFACVSCTVNSKKAHMSYVPSRDLTLILDTRIARSFIDCFQSCVQRSDCLSVYFTTATKLCDRNSAELPANAAKTTVPDIIYADSGLSQTATGTTTASPLSIQVGRRVKRGPTWQWGDQDGGAGNLGTVSADDGIIGSDHWWHVLWDLGQTNNYRMDATYQDLIIVG
ncbi:hypothetical protein CHS0354_032852 [Potamilus streckersoni]|uniref:MIB/HERC2 domain-containing protein n=1 Tax=Potamilus streckersoni TaxID=2493646 RepID=A0AAE0S9L6_9BIVA|nr:hypothetical protein CHS0354_032852 [Potamilus streckersoni]